MAILDAQAGRKEKRIPIWPAEWLYGEEMERGRENVLSNGDGRIMHRPPKQYPSAMTRRGDYFTGRPPLTGNGAPSVSPFGLKPPPSTSTKIGLLIAVGLPRPHIGPITSPTSLPSPIATTITWASAFSARSSVWSNFTPLSPNNCGCVLRVKFSFGSGRPLVR